MKKRILALLLAGLITASMTSCVSSGDQNDGAATTDPNAPVSTTVGPQTEQMQDVNETVYAIVTGSLLTDVNAAAAAAVVSPLTELQRVKYSATWSVVVYNGAQYYIASASLTADDIKGKGFTPCEPIDMYTTTGLKVRPYASLNDSFSKEITTLAINSGVKVIATGTVGGMDWSKIKYTDKDGEHEGFVSSKYLSKTQTVNPDEVDYSQHFEDCAPAIMYVSEEQAAVRSTPVLTADNSNYADTLYKNAKVTVIARGKGDYAGWSQIKYEAKREDPADPQFYLFGYISNSVLSAIQGGEVATLETLISAYGFQKLEPAKTMYVSTEITETLNVRSSPDFSSGANNKIGSVSTKQQVNVVAKGTYGGVFAYIITFGEGYGFVSGQYITVDANGIPMLTLEAIVSKYQFTTADAKTYYAKSDVNCRFTPEGEITRKLTAGDSATVVASGEYKGATLFVLEFDGVYYFAAADLFTETASQG